MNLQNTNDTVSGNVSGKDPIMGDFSLNVKEEVSTSPTLIVTEQEQDAGIPAGPEPTTTSVSTTAAEVNSTGLKRKRLTGAQKKKIRKAEKIKIGTWIYKNPHQKKKEDKWKESGGTKRSWSVSSMPSVSMQFSKKPKKTMQIGSHNTAATKFSLAVIDRRHPDIKLGYGQADLIQNKLITALDETPSGSGSPPQFEGSRYMGGILWITCANEFTADWLKKTVGSLGGLWEGADLTVVNSADLPKRPKVLAWFPGTVEETTVRTRLRRQNLGLNTADWRLLSRKKERDGEILAFSIDAVSNRTLELSKFKAYYGLRTVLFRPIPQGTERHIQDSPYQPPPQYFLDSGTIGSMAVTLPSCGRRPNEVILGSTNLPLDNPKPSPSS